MEELSKRELADQLLAASDGARALRRYVEELRFRAESKRLSAGRMRDASNDSGAQFFDAGAEVLEDVATELADIVGRYLSAE